MGTKNIAQLFGLVPTRLPTRLRGTRGRVHYCGGQSIEAELQAGNANAETRKQQSRRDWEDRNRELRKQYWADRYERQRNDPEFVALNRARSNAWQQQHRKTTNRSAG